MNVTTHSEDPRIARIHFLDYRKRVSVNREERKRQLEEAAKKSRSALYWARKEKSQLHLEDEELMKMYKAMSQGKRVLALGEVFKDAGMDYDRLPKLAIARADWQWCFFRAEMHGEASFSTESSNWGHNKQNSLHVPASFFPAEVTNTAWRSRNSKCGYPVKAMVPTIPATLRPDQPKKYWILWEAEWKKDPPKDPILLYRLGEHTFSVVAEWDLTPLERSVLFGRPS